MNTTPNKSRGSLNTPLWNNSGGRYAGNGHEVIVWGTSRDLAKKAQCDTRASCLCARQQLRGGQREQRLSCQLLSKHTVKQNNKENEGDTERSADRCSYAVLSATHHLHKRWNEEEKWVIGIAALDQFSQCLMCCDININEAVTTLRRTFSSIAWPFFLLSL